MNITIRNEHPNDHRVVETLVRDSFWNVYRPGCLEHYVLHTLRSDPAFVHELNFVMELDGRIIGQNMFMRAAIAADDGRQIPVLCMGPICIATDLQKRGYGKMLLDFAEEKVARQFDTVIVDASQPAKSLYLKRGYREKDYHQIKTENGDYLCYDVMEKSVHP